MFHVFFAKLMLLKRRTGLQHHIPRGVIKPCFLDTIDSNPERVGSGGRSSVLGKLRGRRISNRDRGLDLRMDRFDGRSYLEILSLFEEALF